MPVEITAEPLPNARLVHSIAKGALDSASLPPAALAWAKANGFDGGAGEVLLVPGDDGSVGAALLGLGDGSGGFAPLVTGKLAGALPEGDWAFAQAPERADLACLGLALGGYRFTRYGKKPSSSIRFAAPKGVDAAAVMRRADAVVDGPSPDALAFWDSVRRLPERHRTVMVLYYAGDRSVAEVASILSIPEGTVRSDLTRARAALATEYGA